MWCVGVCECVCVCGGCEVCMWRSVWHGWGEKGDDNRLKYCLIWCSVQMLSYVGDWSSDWSSGWCAIVIVCTGLL